MRGNIRRRGSPGSWQITYELGVQPAQRCKLCDRRYWIDRRPLEVCTCGGELEDTKERRQKAEGGFPRRKDAETALNKILEGLSQGTYVAPNKLTLGEYLRDRWLVDIRNGGRLRPTTLASYETHVVHHLTPRLGATPLQRLNRSLIGAHYKWLADEGRVPKKKPAEKKVDVASDEKPKRPRRKKKAVAEPKVAAPVNTALSPTTVRRVHATLHRALRDAVRNNLLPRNPADDVEFPKPMQRDQRLHAWNSEQLKKFLVSTDGDRLRPLWLLYGVTGARRGELLGLTWDDVDLDAGTITIRRGLVPVGRTLVVGEPKTESGLRTISLPPTTAAVLKRHKAAQAAEKMEHRDIWAAERCEALKGLDLVFTREDGAEMHPDRVSKLFVTAVTKSGQPKITLHGLRHTWATIALLEMKVPINVVSKRLGHKDASITLGIYTHATAQHDEEAAEAFADLVMPQGL